MIRAAKVMSDRGGRLVLDTLIKPVRGPHGLTLIALEDPRARPEEGPGQAGSACALADSARTPLVRRRAEAKFCARRRGKATKLAKISLEHGRTLLSAGALLLLVATPRQAAADERLCAGDRHGPSSCEVRTQSRRPGPDRCIYGGDHKPHTRNLLGSKALFVSTLGLTGEDEGDAHGHSAGGPTATFGVSIFYERELVPSWLEIELNVGLIDGAVGLQVPLDLLLKKPFHLSRRLTPYIGVGPSLELFPRGDRPPLPGVTGGVGVYLWLSRDFGLDLELDYTAHFLSPGLEHVSTLGLGPVLHF